MSNINILINRLIIIYTYLILFIYYQLETYLFRARSIDPEVFSSP